MSKQRVSINKKTRPIIASSLTGMLRVAEGDHWRRLGPLTVGEHRAELCQRNLAEQFGCVNANRIAIHPNLVIDLWTSLQGGGRKRR